MLDIICTGKLEHFVDFETSNKPFLSNYDIDVTTIRYNIRLMTLCALGCDKTNLSFKEIATTLEVDEETVEEWVVDAVGQGLMLAQIDQAMSTVCVSRSAHRSFGPEQWKSLQEKLRGLRARVSTVVDAVKKRS